MIERLPRVYTDILAESIWELGKASMRDIIRIAPVPSRIKGEIAVGNKGLEPEFLIREPAPRAFEVMPKQVALIISEITPYELDPNFEIHNYQRIDINTVRKQRTYETGLVLIDTTGVVITPELSMPAPDNAYRPGSAEWRDLTERIKPRFNRQTVEYFLSSISEAMDTLPGAQDFDGGNNPENL